jgi:aminoglycoside phosphotransferase (APT) family kinase protein
VIAEAARAAGTPLSISEAVVSGGAMVCITDSWVLRVAIGTGQREFPLRRARLDALQTESPPAIVAEKVPWPGRFGKLGLADWALERRLPGTPASATLTNELLSDCLDFLVALNSIGRRESAQPAALAEAEVMASACEPEDARAVRTLAGWAGGELETIPHGFGHGDFWTGNLLTDGGRLVGVVDWEASGPGRLPLLDLFHLYLCAERSRRGWGEAFVKRLLPWATAGNEVVGSYCERMGLELSTAQLHALVAAYWLDYVSYQLKTYADRRLRPQWVRSHIAAVLPALAARAGASSGTQQSRT